MLSESSYLTALYAYTGAAALMLIYLAWWLGRRWPAAWAALAVLLAAAVLLTPAYPGDDVSTMAPALIVAAFQFLTYGPEAATQALKLLGTMCSLALLLALLLRLLVFRRRADRSAAEGAEGAE